MLFLRLHNSYTTNLIFPLKTFQLEIPPSFQTCIGSCPLLGRATTSLLQNKQSSFIGQPSLMDGPSLPIPGKPVLPTLGKSTNFSLVGSPLTSSIPSNQPVPASPENRQSRNFAPKKEQDGQARNAELGRKWEKAESREKDFFNTTSSPIAQWVAQVVFTKSMHL